MKTNARALLGLLLVVLASMFLSGCKESYGCQVTFGASSCTPSGGGLGGGGGTGGTGGGGGGGGTTPTALAYDIVQTGEVNGIAYSSTVPSLTDISGFVLPTVPAADPSAELVIAQKQYLYGIFPQTQLLYGWTIATSGDLTAMNGSPFTVSALGFMVANSTGVNYSGVVTNPDGTFLFIADAGNAEILTFQIGVGGVLTAGPTISTGVIQPWNLAIDGHGQYLYVTEGPIGIGGHVAAYAINQGTGALTLVAPAFAFNIWQLQGDPTGQFMIGISGNSLGITGIADNSIHVFSITQSGATAGALTEVTNSPFTTQFSPINLAVQPNINNGSFVYSFSVDGTGTPNPIEGYALNTTPGASFGALTAIVGAPASPFSGVTASPWGQFDQSGDNLFVYSNTGGILPLIGVVNPAAGTGGLTESVATLPLSTGGYFAVTDPQ
jgi:hypothetical protein